MPAADLQVPFMEAAEHWGCTAVLSVVPDDATLPRYLSEDLSLLLAEGVALRGTTRERFEHPGAC